MASKDVTETNYFDLIQWGKTEFACQYHDPSAQPFIINLFLLDIFAQARSAGLFTYDSRVWTFVTAEVLKDGSLVWTDTSTSFNNPQRKWSYSFHLDGVRDPENNNLIYNALHVFSKLYNLTSAVSLDSLLSSATSKRDKKYNDDQHVSHLSSLKKSKVSSFAESVLMSPVPDSNLTPSALKDVKSKLTKTRSDVKSETKLADELAYALQLIATLTQRVEDLEKLAAKPESTPLFDRPSSALSSLESEPERGLNQALDSEEVKQKLPSQRRRRKKIRANDPNDPRLPLPFPPGHQPNYPPVYYDKRQRRQPKDIPLRARDDPPSRTGINRQLKPFPKPNPAKFLNPKYTETSKREQIEFFKKKIKIFNDELSKLRVNPESLPSEQQSDLLSKRKKIQRGRLRAYKSLECLGVNQFSHNNRIKKHQDDLDRRRDYDPPTRSNQIVQNPFTSNNPYYSPAFANGPPFSGYPNVVYQPYMPPTESDMMYYNYGTRIGPYAAFNALPTDVRRNYARAVQPKPKNNSNRPNSRQSSTNLSDTASKNFAL